MEEEDTEGKHRGTGRVQIALKRIKGGGKLVKENKKGETYVGVSIVKAEEHESGDKFAEEGDRGYRNVAVGVSRSSRRGRRMKSRIRTLFEEIKEDKRVWVCEYGEGGAREAGGLRGDRVYHNVL